jgi:solute carrier family 25 carnitine/acylcarnitine transporter 20/29
MQSNNKLSFLKCLKNCINKEGFKGFYKGMTFPLCSVPLVNAIVFGFHEITKKLLNFHDEEKMDIYEGIICGMVAGIANCIVVTPVELVKCRLQIQEENKTKSYYKGVFDCVRKTFREANAGYVKGIKNLYKGNIATLYREVPAYAAQFGGYYYAKQLVAKYRNKCLKDLSNFDLMICGGIGGYMCWQFSYPQDVIKTLLQTKFQTSNKTWDGGFYSCMKNIYHTSGLLGFWRGYLPCTLRAIIANSVLFATYENTKFVLSDIL